MSTIRYKRPRSDDPYLEFDGSIVQYSHKMASFIIPFDYLNLLKHLTEYSKFIDALYNEDKVATKLKSIQNNDEEMESSSSKDCHNPLWFLNMDDDDEMDTTTTTTTAANNNDMQIDEHFAYDKLCNLSWEWHNNIKSREAIFTSLYAINYFLSWGAFCRSYYLNIMIIDQKEVSRQLLQRCASQYKFTGMVDATHYIIVHDEPIMQYSIQFIFHAIKVAIPVLYTYSYSFAMKEYIYHLFLRYCSIISVSCTNEKEEGKLLDHPSHFIYHNSKKKKKNKDGDEENDGGVSKHIPEEEDFNEFKKTCIKMNTRYSITSNYIYLGETLFYSHLARLNLSTRLVEMAKEHPVKFNEYKTTRESVLLIKLCLDAWHKFICDTSLHKHIGTSVKEGFHVDAMHLFLYHGEKEHFKRSWPESNHEPGDIISQTRPDDFTTLQAVRQIVIKDISTIFYKAYIQFLNNIVLNDEQQQQQQHNGRTIHSIDERDTYTPKTSGGNTTNMSSSIYTNSGGDNDTDICTNDTCLNVPSMDHEKECVLATKVCTINWFKYNNVESWKTINESFIIEELCDTMSPIDNIFIDHERMRRYKLKHPAYLVRLMRIYYVIDINLNEIEIYQTDVFPKAYFVWLSLLIKYNYIKESILHKDIGNVTRVMLNKLL